MVCLAVHVRIEAAEMSIFLLHCPVAELARSTRLISPFPTRLEMLRKQGCEVRSRRYSWLGCRDHFKQWPSQDTTPHSTTPFPRIVVTESSNYFGYKCVQSFVIALHCLLCRFCFISGERHNSFDCVALAELRVHVGWRHG